MSSSEFTSRPTNPVTVLDVASLVSGEIYGDPATVLTGPCALAAPERGRLCFATSVDLLEASDPGQVGAVVIAGPSAAPSVTGTAIIVDNPRHAFAVAATRFFSDGPTGTIAASARVHSSADIGSGVSVGEHTVIGPGVVIGSDSVIRHNVVISAGVQIGRRCVVNSNTVIGEAGFGMAVGDDGRHVRLPHFGSVVMGDDVEVGALTTIVAGTFQPTVVDDGVKIDDHVHIAHNVHIGRNSLVVACAEVSGSVELGESCWIGPNASIIDGVTLVGESFIGIGATVIRSVTDPGVYAGNPVRLIRSASADGTGDRS